MDICWNIELLGGLRLRRGDQLITHFRTQNTAALLAHLAYYPHQRHRRDVLIDMLWPESGPASGRHNLSLALSALRRQMETDTASGRDSKQAEVLIADRSSVQLNPERIMTDVALFNQTLESASHSRDRAQRVHLLTQAVDLYQGPLLPGFYENWFLPEQQRLTERFWGAVNALLPLLEEQGDTSRALDYARRAVNLHPVLEDAHRELMRLLAVTGAVPAALRQYGQLERALSQHFGSRPSASTRALADAIQSDFALFRSPPSDPVASSQAMAAAPAPDHSLPTGTVTFVWARVENTALALALPEEPADTATHERRPPLSQRALLLREARRWNGYLIHNSASSMLIAFKAAAKALDWAIASQHAVAVHSSEGVSPVAMALHTGDVDLLTGGYQGEALGIGEGLLRAAHSGQILCCEATSVLLQRQLKPGIGLVDLGAYRLPNIDVVERLYQAQYPDMAQRAFPPPDADPAQDTA